MHPPPAKLALSVHFGGIRRNPCTQSNRLITRRSRVQIPPPLLERPRNGAFRFSGSHCSGHTFAQLLPAERAGTSHASFCSTSRSRLLGRSGQLSVMGSEAEPASAAARAEVALLGDEGAGRLVERAGRLRSREEVHVDATAATGRRLD